jgi:transposase
MLRIPQARKEAILNKMLSPYPPTVAALSQQEGISEATLYNWRKQLRQEGRPVPEHDRTSEYWSAQTKFAVVVESVAMTEGELAAELVQRSVLAQRCARRPLVLHADNGAPM